MKYIYFSICIIALAGVGCTKQSNKPLSQASPQIGQQARSSAAEAIYPHSDKFKSTKTHGLEYFSNPDTCKGCHGKDLGGGNVKVACNSCHGIFPHSEEFKTTTAHGAQYFKDKLSCTQCHGANYGGGDSTISCRKCHPYPHEAKWALQTNHGAAYVDSLKEENAKDKTKDCLHCHGETNSLKDRHPEEFVSCGTCHPLIPHNDDFKYPDNASGEHATMARSYQGQCTLCHTDLKRLMPEMGEDGCYSCHNTGEIPTVRWEKKP